MISFNTNLSIGIKDELYLSASSSPGDLLPQNLAISYQVQVQVLLHKPGSGVAFAEWWNGKWPWKKPSCLPITSSEEIFWVMRLNCSPALFWEWSRTLLISMPVLRQNNMKWAMGAAAILRSLKSEVRCSVNIVQGFSWKLLPTDWILRQSLKLFFNDTIPTPPCTVHSHAEVLIRMVHLSA